MVRKKKIKLSSSYRSSSSPSLSLTPTRQNNKGKLDEIANGKDKYNFQLTKYEIELPGVRVGTSSVINLSEVCGRKKEKDSIISELVSESSLHNTGISIMSIVGMGGIGTTTLAQLIFNDDKVISYFEKSVWVCVSNPFDLLKLPKHLRENVPDDIELESLHHLLCNSIKGKQFLLVLDDVLTDDPEKWNPLKAALNGGARGSRIVVTTRSARVAMIMGSTHIHHHLELLSEDDLWSLFSGVAFAGRGGGR
ncbi:hypothetical protein GIB67_031777 [Kingdonia uniflora]|uniref:NB-ARC domain-containing protein n=1 Tax=Kingdonia uniflora TaxID=39325 RepID=A0A7J7L4M1_9MAGN|nr:hypothetical protein GIB67_031777 [Kingdonia uniflora]